MENSHELWGQIGVVFHLTGEEMERLLCFDQDSMELFLDLIRDRRYEICDQFYSPESGKGIYINLHDTVRTDAAWTKRSDHDLYPRKIWCRLGVAFPLNEAQLQILSKGDRASAELVFDLIDSGRYKADGSCLFESGNEIDGFDEPDRDRYIDLYQDGTSMSATIPIAGISFN